VTPLIHPGDETVTIMLGGNLGRSESGFVTGHRFRGCGGAAKSKTQANNQCHGNNLIFHDPFLLRGVLMVDRM
jgi:hypothetical protein